VGLCVCVCVCMEMVKDEKRNETTKELHNLICWGKKRGKKFK